MIIINIFAFATPPSMDYVDLSRLIQQQAATYGKRAALKFRERNTQKWETIAWDDFSSKVETCANALIAAGIKQGERIAVFSQNMPELLYVNFAAYAAGAVVVPLYATSSPAQAEYMLNDSKAKVLFVGEQYQFEAASQVVERCPNLELIVAFDPEVQLQSTGTTTMHMRDFMAKGTGMPYEGEIARRREQAAPEDLVDILYTSGTTGEPKGVELTRENYMQAFINHDTKLNMLTSDDVALDFLPLAHIFERAWTYFCLQRGVLVCINTDPSAIQEAILQIRPTVMCSVPRFWEKVYSIVTAKMAHTKGIVKLILYDALKTGKTCNIDRVVKGIKPSLWTKAKHWFYNKTVYEFLKRRIGIEKGNFFPTAGAAVPEKVFEFCRSVGIRMLTGYGLTETTATVSMSDPDNFKIGAVGEIMPNIEVRIANDGEIQIKGATVTKGYYNKPEANKQAFTPDGWFRTGDAGRFENGTLYITERIKDLFKTSNGKYIAPQAIETALVVDACIDQACIIADNRKYVAALIVPDYKQLEEHAKKQGIECKTKEELVTNKAVYELMARRIAKLQTQFAYYEQVKRFTLLAEPFDMAKRELTNTLKLRRQTIYENHAAEIDKMYEE